MKKKVAINIKEKYTDSNHYQKHFTLDDRIKIQKIITEYRDESGNLTILLKDIGKMLENDPSTISKEVKKHRVFTGRTEYTSYKCINEICSNYEYCFVKGHISANPNAFLKTTCMCIKYCEEYKERICPNLKKFPWVCNGCQKHSKCRLNKYYYYSDTAQKDYLLTLKESREGINLTPDEFNELDHLITSQLKGKCQPIAHIVNSNDLPVSERTIYNYFENGYFTAKNVDLRRKVTYKKRKVSKDSPVVIRKIKIGRMYSDYQKYIEENPDLSIVQMDTVEGLYEEKGYLLTRLLKKLYF